MTHRSRRLLLAVGAIVCAGTLGILAQPKGEKVTLKGEIVDMWCYMAVSYTHLTLPTIYSV